MFPEGRHFSPLALACFAMVVTTQPGWAVPVEVEAIAVPSRNVTLSLPVEATVRELRVKEGDLVKKGEVLATLYQSSEVLERDRAAKLLERAAVDLRMSERLRLSETVSEEAARQKRLDHDLANIELDRSNAVLADKTLFAPFDGVILRIHKEVGESAGRTDKIIEVIGYDTLHIEAYLEAVHLGSVAKGQKARVIFPSLSDREVVADFLLVDPVVEPGSGLFRVRLSVANADLTIPSGIPARLIFESPLPPSP